MLQMKLLQNVVLLFLESILPFKWNDIHINMIRILALFRVSNCTGGNIFGSVVVTTKTGIPVKIVIIRNCNKKSECLYLLSTDFSLSDAEIVRIYGNRWSIECFFKAF